MLIVLAMQRINYMLSSNSMLIGADMAGRNFADLFGDVQAKG